MDGDTDYQMLNLDAPGSDSAHDLLDDADHPAADYDPKAQNATAEQDSPAGGSNEARTTFGAIVRHPLMSAAVLLLLIGVAIGGVSVWSYLQSYQNTDDAQVDAHISPISSRISGTITGVYVENNQRVKAGQLLVKLDPHDYEVALEQARAQLAQSRADANSARQQYVSALAKIRQDQAHDYQARRDQQRYSTLFQLHVVSQQAYDQYNATARVDDANVSADQADAASALRTIASRDAQATGAQAVVDQALLNLSYTRIVAPADGIIGKRSGEVGERVDPGQSLMAVTQVNDLWVTANFKETQLARMRRRERVTIHVDALDRDYAGHVESMPGGTGALYSLLPPENATGNYVKVVERLPVRILFDSNQDLSRLRPGMSVEPTVWLN